MGIMTEVKRIISNFLLLLFASSTRADKAVLWCILHWNHRSMAKKIMLMIDGICYVMVIFQLSLSFLSLLLPRLSVRSLMINYIMHQWFRIFFNGIMSFSFIFMSVMFENIRLWQLERLWGDRDASTLVIVTCHGDYILMVMVMVITL